MKKNRDTGKIFSFLVLIGFINCGLSSLAAEELPVKYNRESDQLEYHKDTLGNQVPDFSYCGYKASNEAIPNVPTKVFVSWKKGDATHRIQKAIDYLSQKPLDENGFRGAILLDKGEFKLEGRLRISKAGIIIRGSSAGKEGTTLIAAGTDRETFITVCGSTKIKDKTEYSVSKEYIPVNSMKLVLEDKGELKVGDIIAIRRPSTQEWVDTLDVFDFVNKETEWLGWKPGRNNIIWYREIKAIDGNTITIDAPITTALDPQFGGGYVSKYTIKDGLQNVGIENLNLVSEFDQNNLKDENHCWMAITIENAENCWVRQVNFKHFAGSAVMVLASANKITVEDCISEEPVSEIAAQRRYTFFTEGQQVLFQRCHSEYGYHDFSTGNFAAGPNAFVQCEAYLPFSFSGTIDRWASGVLFDVVTIDGGMLSFKNREADYAGAGWTAANSMMWECAASRINCYAPPTANNWAFGVWGQFLGNGYWYQANEHISPRSLFYAQLKQRLGKDVSDQAQLMIPVMPGSTSSPTVEQAAEYTELAHHPLPLLIDWIKDANTRNPIPTDSKQAFNIDNLKDAKTKIAQIKNPVKVENGWLVDNNGVACGDIMGVPWWRGDIRPHYVSKAAPGITRWVPGRTGTGLTDNIDSVTKYMHTNNYRAVDHHYGLWYERRRMDHERIRRMDGEVWAPFYEMPFSRSGVGTAWDGLSKYDLTKPNTWYWSRLKTFADKADNSGLVLMHENYFQHNILEAGAHYVDSPWRTANNINNPGLPEPPPFSGDKRIFIADQFYDLSNESLKDLHKQYIRQCLNNFKDNSNVIQLISGEYTGPLEFTQFWLDVIAEWEEETGKHPLIGLSTTKDVQDAILEDKERAAIVDVIDIKYWQYREDGSLYAPEGGKNLAPRQFKRLTEPGKFTFESIYRAVSEYREKYPNKAVIYSNNKEVAQNWAVFMAGGSFAAIPANTPKDLIKSAVTMHPEKQKSTQNLYLINDQKEQIIYCKEKDVKVDLKKISGKFSGQWIDVKTGEPLKEKVSLESGKSQLLKAPQTDVILWVVKK